MLNIKFFGKKKEAVVPRKYPRCKGDFFGLLKPPSESSHAICVVL
jgi:hypothetical protein